MPPFRTLVLPVVLVLASLACSVFGGGETPTAEPSGPSVVIQPSPGVVLPQATEAGPGPEMVGATVADLARATVQILALVTSGEQTEVVWTGSGSIISPEGLVLTNGHVVDNRYGEYDVLGVAITDRSDQPPQLLYLGEIAAVDYDLDLAIVRIVSDLSGNAVTVNLPSVGMGNSDAVEIGDALRILGYPGIGGETISFTQGAVSGFTSERGVQGRAWMKTDATIAGGNSGGMGVNSAGELIGVPTIASSGAEDSDIVDCRIVADSNGDGVVDEQDTCVPIGGFLNGLRPANLALPLIEAARSGQEYVVGAQPEQAPAGGFDISYTQLYNLQFSDGVTEDDQPTQLWWAFPSGPTQICAFWDYEGMVNGMRWSAYWYVNGTPDEGASYVDEIWEGGEVGNWWVCIMNDAGLDDGLYELILHVEGEWALDESVFAGGDRQIAEFTLQNNSSAEVCYLFLSPNQAQRWGGDELGAEETIGPGGSGTIQVVTGTYDMMLLDCDANKLLDDYGLEVGGAFTYTLTD